MATIARARWQESMTLDSMDNGIDYTYFLDAFLLALMRLASAANSGSKKAYNACASLSCNTFFLNASKLGRLCLVLIFELLFS